MLTQDATAERAIAESRLRSLTTPGRRLARPVSHLQDPGPPTGDPFPDQHPTDLLPDPPPALPVDRPLAGPHVGHPGSGPLPAPPSAGPAGGAIPSPRPDRPGRVTLRDAQGQQDGSGPPGPHHSGSPRAPHLRHPYRRDTPPAHATPGGPPPPPSRLRASSASFHQAPALSTSHRDAPAPRREETPTVAPASLQAFRAALAAKAPGLDPGGPALKALAALAVLAALVAGIYLWRSQPLPEPLPTPPPPAPVPHRHVPATPSRTAGVTVHVTGKVRKPGIYTLPPGARVADAVTAAGGARPATATASVNLARRLLDGEQILIGAPPGAAPPGPAPVPGSDPAAMVLDLNTATAEQLEELPGVGEVLAARIAEFRTANGGFASVDQLQEVPGIGAKKYAEIKARVRV